VSLKFVIVATNNHYVGLGTVNIFRNMLGLPEAKWEEREEEQERPTLDSKQRTFGNGSWM
jgi:hypothetical protein